MPIKILTRLTNQLRSKGNSNAKGMAIALLTKQGTLKNDKLTAKGRVRNAMTPAERAKDRQAKYSGHKSADFKYNASTNRATLKSKKK